MPDAQELQSVVEAAEQAAAAGDYASAERLLREVASLQEASLGALHPDLANTLNNLGVVCEITGKDADAGQFFRRSSSIAAAALPPDHPFVATSRKNLGISWTARGKPVDLPTAPAPSDAPAQAPLITDLIPPKRSERPVASAPSATHVAPAPSDRGLPSRTIAIIGAVVVVFLIAAAAWLRSPRRTGSSSPSPTATQSAPSAPARPSASSPVASAPPRATGSTSDRRAAVVPKTPPPIAPERKTARGSSRVPVVATAELCKGLSTSGEWRCVTAGNPAGPGALFFYTRIKSPTATTVLHRWYRGDRLRQSVELSVQPNTKDGYRTFSRNTVDSGNGGDWKVELRTKDGVLLHEERFVVR